MVAYGPVQVSVGTVLPCAVCCQVEETATGRSLDQRNLTKCGVFFVEPYRGSLGPLCLLIQEKKETKV